MYEARWQTQPTQPWIPVDVAEAARLLRNHPQGSNGALDALNEGRKSIAVAYVDAHPAETSGWIEVRLREHLPATRGEPTPDDTGELLWA